VAKRIKLALGIEASPRILLNGDVPVRREKHARRRVLAVVGRAREQHREFAFRLRAVHIGRERHAVAHADADVRLHLHGQPLRRGCDGLREGIQAKPEQQEQGGSRTAVESGCRVIHAANCTPKAAAWPAFREAFGVL
jgi:hypothetical protein